MTRVTVPAASGEEPRGWFELRPVSSLTPDHQDEAGDLLDALFERKRAELPPAGPDPRNPAVMAEEPQVQLVRRDLWPRYGLLLAWVLEGSSYGFDTARLAEAAAMPPGDDRIAKLGEVLGEERRKLPLPAWNVLRTAMEPHFAALNGDGPKGTLEQDGTITGT